jgi:hypothetical protein
MPEGGLAKGVPGGECERAGGGTCEVGKEEAVATAAPAPGGLVTEDMWPVCGP